MANNTNKSLPEFEALSSNSSTPPQIKKCDSGPEQTSDLSDLNEMVSSQTSKEGSVGRQRESTRRVSPVIILRLSEDGDSKQIDGDTGDTSPRDVIETLNTMEPVLTKKKSSIQMMLDETPSIRIWPRVLLLFLCIFLFALSSLYCIAQILEVKLKVLTDCPEPKTPEEIWEHSYQLSLNEDGESIINRKSHFGHNEKSCWSPRGIQINTDGLWFSNKYDWNWSPNINSRFISFGLVSLCMAMVVLYGVITLITDLKAICNGTIHKKSREYRQHIKSLKLSSLHTASSAPSPTSTASNYIKKCQSILSLFHYDTATWMTLRVMGECTEFLLQSAAFLRYGGYDLFNTGDTPLAEKPGAIIGFASALCFNCIGSGIMWLSYALLPGHCFGEVYSRCLFWIDKLSDLLYALFPVYVILSDDYNSKTDIMVLLGLLHQDGIQFVATIFPLCMLTHRCIFTAIQTTRKMRSQYFNKWISDPKNTRISRSSRRRKSPEFDSYSVTSTYPDICKVTGGLTANHAINCNHCNRSWINKESNIINQTTKRMIVLFVSSIFLLFGSVVITAALYYVNVSISHCNSVTETTFLSNGINVSVVRMPSDEEQRTLSTNPELFAYDQCQYKVYPFTDDEIYRCQCRVFVIDWETDFQSTNDERKEYFNLTQPVMMDGMMRHWFMMEKLKTFGIDKSVNYNVSWNAMRDTVHLKAIQWKHIPITGFHSDHFDHWKQLEYLAIYDTLADSIVSLPESLGRLENLRYIESDTNSFDNHFPALCNVTSLETLWFYSEVVIEVIPDCMDQLIHLRLLVIEVSGLLKTFPLSLLSLPQLSGFSLSRNAISWDSLLDGNMPSDIDRNDTNAVMEWLDEYFIFSDETEYYLSLNPICYENVSFLSPRITEFMITACAFPVDLSEAGTVDSFCSPWLLGDGDCDSPCNDESLLFDMGDCMHLCFAEEISNCTLDKLANDRCDPGCDNRYCVAYDALAVVIQDVELDDDLILTVQDDNGTLYGPDSFHCPWNGTVESPSDYPLCSASSTESAFIDPNIPEEAHTECDPSWIGDTLCDDSCRVSDCGFDEGDCNAGCTDEVCSVFYTVWIYFTADQHILNFTYGCDVMYPTVLAFFDLLDVVNCSEQIRSLDYNQDGMMNFREFVVFGMMANNDFDPDLTRASQTNCSFCGDSEYYNLYVED